MSTCSCAHSKLYTISHDCATTNITTITRTPPSSTFRCHSTVAITTRILTQHKSRRYRTTPCPRVRDHRLPRHFRMPVSHQLDQRHRYPRPPPPRSIRNTTDNLLRCQHAHPGLSHPPERPTPASTAVQAMHCICILPRRVAGTHKERSKVVISGERVANLKRLRPSPSRVSGERVIVVAFLGRRGLGRETSNEERATRASAAM